VPEDAAAASLLLRNLAGREVGTDQLIRTAIRQSAALDARSTTVRSSPVGSSPLLVLIALPVRLAAKLLRPYILEKVKGPGDDAASEAASLLARTSAAESNAVAEKVAADPENMPALRKTAADLRKAGVSSRTRKETLLTVVTWLVMLGLPAAIPMVPASDQGTIVNEVATVGLAIAITDHIRREKD
jgi:hypothetical protein